MMFLHRANGGVVGANIWHQVWVLFGLNFRVPEHQTTAYKSNVCLGQKVLSKTYLKPTFHRKTADVIVDDFKAVVGKLRQSYKNLNVNNVGIFGQGLG